MRILEKLSVFYCPSPQYYKSLIEIPIPKTGRFVFGGLFLFLLSEPGFIGFIGL
jgi:hypothetical protein